MQGILTLAPGSTNVCPGEVKLTIDMRHPDDAQLDKIEADIYKEAKRIANADCEQGCQLSWNCTTRSKAVVFDDECVNAVREAAVNIVGRDMVRDIFSGAGHDSFATVSLKRFGCLADRSEQLSSIGGVSQRDDLRPV